MADSVLDNGTRSPVQPDNSWETAWCCLSVLCSYARTPPALIWSDLSIISFSGSPFWYNLEAPDALNIYWLLATLVAYTWRPWMTKLCALKQNDIVWRVLLSVVHSQFLGVYLIVCGEWKPVILQSKCICSHQHAVLRLEYRVILTKMPTTLSDNFVFYECFPLCAKY